MALRAALLCSLIGSLLGQGAEDVPISDCCKDGEKRGNENKDCASLPLISASITCRIVQEQCCTAALEDIMCKTGINLAKQQGVCDFLLNNTCEMKTSKTCCDCCLLGKVMKELSLPCNGNLPLSHQCMVVSQTCCMEETPGSKHPVDPNPPNMDESSNNGDNSVLSDECEGKCAHHCLKNNTCACVKGYKLNPDGKNCDDINECLMGLSDCRAGERCINTEGSFRCQREVSCGTGYELTDSNNCKDIDECETGIHNCGPQFNCQNTQGSFRCIPKVKCDSGYIQDALGNCIDINECMTLTNPCHRGQICINSLGSYSCQRNSVNCGRGYHLSDDGTRCVDIDECKGSEEVCPGHACINQVGSYRCECATGYNFNSISRTCEDVNECRYYPGRLCAHKCENTLGSYKCSCTTGFKLADDGRNCDDVNECENNPCSQECANVYGSYQCYCRRGYQLSDIDGLSCEDIDECALPTGGHICTYRCRNIPGSFSCICPPEGYTLAANGRSCQDLDECVAGSHTCTENESCFNIQGGFRCLSFVCPNNYKQVGETRCERLLCTDSVECLKLPVRITFYYVTFTTDIPASTNFFRMGPSQSFPGDHIQIAITAGNEGGFFRAERISTGGVLSVAKPINEAHDFKLSVELRLRRHGELSTYLARVLVFVTEELPKHPLLD